MKFINYLCPHCGKAEVGVIAKNDTILPLAEIDAAYADLDMIGFIKICDDEKMAAIKAAAEAEGPLPLEGTTLLSPIEYPIHDIMCVGVNYMDHREEDGDEAYMEQTDSVYFGKRAVKIIGPEADIISNPELDPKLDYEVELAVIIGKEGKDIAKEDAEDYVFGYSVFNDVSSRILQSRHDQWYRGKSLDTYSAMGPCIVTKDELPMPVEVDILSFLNDEPRQHSNTRMMLNDVSGIIRDLSQATTIEPGDIIATGTCAGVGFSLGFMKEGDTITCEIPEIGKLVNHIK